MPSRHIQSFRSIFLPPEDEASGLDSLLTQLPKRAARRMSRLGIMMYNLLEEIPLDLRTTVVYGTIFSESSALETYLDSIPFASPTAFQTSIHPGGIEQALILKQREVGAFFPVAGGAHLLLPMLKLAFSIPSADVVLCGGEEKGSWLREFGLAYDRSFAYALHLGSGPQQSIGELIWEPEAPVSEESIPTTEEAIRRISAGQPVEFRGAGHGCLRVLPT